MLRFRTHTRRPAAWRHALQLKSGKRVVVLGVLVGLFGLTSNAAAATGNFTGAWSGTDPDDGSRLLALIGGPPSGPVSVTFIDQFASACGAPATAIGSGTISGLTLSATLNIRCGGAPVATGVPFTFQLDGGTLLLDGVPLTRLSVAAPTLSVTSVDRRPQVTFSAPRARNVTIYFASKPDRATDGRFFTENVKTLDSMTDDEIASGRWVSESRLNPGTYYVMLRASPDFDRCYISETGDYDPTCANGYSNVAPLTIPKPPTRYSARAEVLSDAGIVHATLRASQLGEKRAYRVCYRAVTRAQRCTRGTLDGYS